MNENKKDNLRYEIDLRKPMAPDYLEKVVKAVSRGIPCALRDLFLKSIVDIRLENEGMKIVLEFNEDEAFRASQFTLMIRTNLKNGR